MEDGEVRDDDDDSGGTDQVDVDYGVGKGAMHRKVAQRVSESEIIDEDNFFYGGGLKQGDLSDFDNGPDVYI